MRSKFRGNRCFNCGRECVPTTDALGQPYMGCPVCRIDLSEPAKPTADPASADREPREPGCKCHWEVGDSPCPVHGENEDPAITDRAGEGITLEDCSTCGEFRGHGHGMGKEELRYELLRLRGLLVCVADESTPVGRLFTLREAVELVDALLGSLPEQPTQRPHDALPQGKPDEPADDEHRDG